MQQMQLMQVKMFCRDIISEFLIVEGMLDLLSTSRWVNLPTYARGMASSLPQSWPSYDDSQQRPTIRSLGLGLAQVIQPTPPGAAEQIP